MILLHDTKMAYHGRRVLQIEGAAFQKGEITAVIGRNGSGKTSLLKTVVGMCPYDGSVTVDGNEVSALDAGKRARSLSYLPQALKAGGLTVETLVMHGRFPYQGLTRRMSEKDRGAVESALAVTQLAQLRERDLRSLSGGERQRAYLAMALAQDADYLLLDEATANLDIEYQMEILRILRDLRDAGKGIILTSHDLPQSFSFADRVLLIDHGRVVSQGRPEEISKQVIRDTMGIGLREQPEDRWLYRYGLSKEK